MKVLKFGGTSVGSVESLRNVKAIVEGCTDRKIVVVSALGGITDMLIATAKQAAADDISYMDRYTAMIERHIDVVMGVVPESRRAGTLGLVKNLLNELGNIYCGVTLLRELSKRSLDIIVSYGERISSIIVSNMLDNATHFDSRKFIKTRDDGHGTQVLDNDATQAAIADTIAADPTWTTAIIGGFIATDDKGDVTNLGRGGSDYTAAIMAAAFDASVLEIWTDVDGFMTADPKVINNTYVIDHLSYAEAMELCNFGAKVVYPPTIYPVYHKNIPILVKNTFNPSSPGTLISTHRQHHAHPDREITGISSIKETSLITISSLCMVGVIGVNTRIFSSLSRNGVSVFLVSQTASENNTTIAVRTEDSDLAVSVLRNEFAAELASGMFNDISVESGLSTVAVVGESMRNNTGVAGKLFNTLGRNGINVKACAQGALETNISIVIEQRSLRKALNVIHDSFFLSESQVLNLFIIGIGNVGSSLMRQITQQQEKLLKEKNLRLNVVGVASSTLALFDRNGIDTSDYREEMRLMGHKSSPEYIADEVIKMNIFNSVFVDCTAAPEIGDLYATLLEHNVNIVAANKLATSSEYSNYRKLKDLARKKDVKYLFETNVGAGLPIISTINALTNSGDRILKIEAVVSGTLNFMFNHIDANTPLSRTIEMAQEARITEPDPRNDLSGLDVVRKLVILAREAGYQLNQEEVERNLFVPNDVFEGSLEDFLTKIKAVDEEFERYRAQACAQGERLRFVATLDNGHGSVGLQVITPDHPFYSLEGSNNVVLLTTERYHDYPMVIKGYGAGADVTAAGVFADIFSIANIR